MIYPNEHITLEKLMKMVDNPSKWSVFAESKFTKNKVPITNYGDLREYAFCMDYTFCYDYHGDGSDLIPNYRNEHDISYHWVHGNLEIRKSSQGRYELVKWEDLEPEAPRSPSCMTLLYWDHSGDIVFVGNRPFEDIDIDDLKAVWKALKTTQVVVDVDIGNKDDE